MSDFPRNTDYKEILKTWAEAHEITPAQLQVFTKYSYQHTWDLLRGNREVNEATIGRILTALPAELGQDLYEAISAQKQDSTPDVEMGIPVSREG